MLKVLLLPWSSKCIIDPCSCMKKVPKWLQKYILQILQIFLNASRSYFFLPLPNPPWNFLIFYMNYIEYIKIWIHNSHLPQLNANCKNAFFVQQIVVDIGYVHLHAEYRCISLLSCLKSHRSTYTYLLKLPLSFIHFWHYTKFKLDCYSLHLKYKPMNAKWDWHWNCLRI